MKTLTASCFVLITLLSGCTDDRLDFVQSEMKQLQDRQSKDIAQSPVFIPVKNFNYNANYLRSPFIPPTLSERLEAERQNVKNQVVPDQDRPLEPLESYGVEQLNMKGIVEDVDGSRYGLIEDPTGTLHRVVVGNYMGSNNGRIADIDARKIDIIEIVKDGKNGFVERPKSLLAPEL